MYVWITDGNTSTQFLYDTSVQPELSRAQQGSPNMYAGNTAVPSYHTVVSAASLHIEKKVVPVFEERYDTR